MLNYETFNTFGYGVFHGKKYFLEKGNCWLALFFVFKGKFLNLLVCLSSSNRFHTNYPTLRGRQNHGTKTAEQHVPDFKISHYLFRPKQVFVCSEVFPLWWWRFRKFQIVLIVVQFFDLVPLHNFYCGRVVFCGMFFFHRQLIDCLNVLNFIK